MPLYLSVIHSLGRPPILGRSHVRRNGQRLYRVAPTEALAELLPAYGHRRRYYSAEDILTRWEEALALKVRREYLASYLGCLYEDDFDDDCPAMN